MSQQSKLHVTIQTPEESSFDGECISVRLKTDDGEIEILPDHTNLVSTLTYSETTLTLPDGSEKIYALRSGVILMINDSNRLSINVFFAELLENVKHESILAYHKEILERLKDGDLSPLQVRFLENQSESIKEMVEIHEK